MIKAQCSSRIYQWKFGKWINTFCFLTWTFWVHNDAIYSHKCTYSFFNKFPKIDFLDIFMVISLDGILISKIEKEHDFRDCQMDPLKVLRIRLVDIIIYVRCTRVLRTCEFFLKWENYTFRILSSMHLSCSVSHCSDKYSRITTWRKSLMTP